MAKELQDPGAFLALMLEKYKLNPSRLSQDIHLSQSAVRLLTIGKAKITVSVAMRLAQYFNTNPEFWLAMQMKWDIAEAGKDKALMKIVKSISRVSKGAASSAAKKPAAKKPAARKKPAAKKKAAAAKKPRAAGSAARKKAAVARKPAAKRRVVAPKKPVSRKKTVAARKKVAVKARKKTSVRRGRPAKKR